MQSTIINTAHDYFSFEIFAMHGFRVALVVYYHTKTFQCIQVRANLYKLF